MSRRALKLLWKVGSSDRDPLRNPCDCHSGGGARPADFWTGSEPILCRRTWWHFYTFSGREIDRSTASIEFFVLQAGERCGNRRVRRSPLERLSKLTGGLHVERE